MDTLKEPLESGKANISARCRGHRIQPTRGLLSQPLATTVETAMRPRASNFDFGTNDRLPSRNFKEIQAPIDQSSITAHPRGPGPCPARVGSRRRASCPELGLPATPWHGLRAMQCIGLIVLIVPWFLAGQTLERRADWSHAVISCWPAGLVGRLHEPSVARSRRCEGPFQLQGTR